MWHPLQALTTVLIALSAAAALPDLAAAIAPRPLRMSGLVDGLNRAVAAERLVEGRVLDAEGKVTYTGSGAGQDIEAAVLTGLE